MIKIYCFVRYNKLMKPTRELYDFFTNAYDYFNRGLFEDMLAPCMLTVQRQKGCMGLFYPERWITDKGQKCHELALNPSYFANYRLIELFQTLVHEQCHMWQQEYGNPSRSGYHNRQWANKMESIGLMPSDTGNPGGKRTGQCMSDYPIQRGRFLEVASEFLKTGRRLTWIDRYHTLDGKESSFEVGDNDKIIDDNLQTPIKALFQNLQSVDLQPMVVKTNKNKVKYLCKNCDINVWGKPELHIVCGKCGVRFSAA